MSDGKHGIVFVLKHSTLFTIKRAHLSEWCVEGMYGDDYHESGTGLHGATLA